MYVPRLDEESVQHQLPLIDEYFRIYFSGTVSWSMKLTMEYFFLANMVNILI